MSGNVTVRSAVAGDVPAIAGVYGHAIRTGIATFDVQDPPAAYWTERIGDTTPGRHLLVAERDGLLLGFAYASAFRPRPGFRHTVETSIYLAPAASGAGVGTLLYHRLLTAVSADGAHTAVAVIARPNPASEALHARFGYAPVGTLREVGHKFDRWVDIGLHQRFLAWDRRPETITTTRLTLTPLSAANADEMVAVLADLGVHDFIGGEPPTLEQLQRRYTAQEVGRSDDGLQDWFNWIARIGEGAAVGTVQATVTGVGASAELAWVIGKAWQGKGFAREAASAMAGWLRARGVGRLLAHVHPAHAASEAVARAVGLTLTEHIKDGERRWEWRTSG